MAKSRDLKRLNNATVELQAPGAWLIDETVAGRLRDAMVAAWERRDGDFGPLAAAIGVTPRPTEPVSELLQIVDGVAVVEVSGMLFPRPNVWTYYGYGTACSDVVDAVNEALSRGDVRGVLLWVDSPGGRAAGVFEAVRAIRSAVEASGKPLWSFTDGSANSGGYAFATAGSRIIATPSAVVGSVGAIMIHSQFRPTDTTYTVVRYGEGKALGNPYEKFDAAASDQWQKLVDATGQQFEQLVADMRGVSVANVQARFGRGLVFMGTDAVGRGLVDEVVELPDVAIAKLRAFAGGSTPTSSVAAARVQANNAGVPTSNGSTSSGTPAQSVDGDQTPRKGVKVNPKIKAALFVRDLIAAVDAADDICSAALAAFFAGRGQPVPKDDAATIAALNDQGVRTLSATLESTAAPLVLPAAGGAAPNVVEAHHRELEEARSAARVEAQAAEAKRVADLRARGSLLGVDVKTVDEAIAKNLSVAAAVDAWTANMEKERSPLAVSVSETGALVFERDALDALLIRCGQKAEKASDEARRMGRAGIKMHALARMSLKVQGVRIADYADDEQVGNAALRAGVANWSETVRIDDGQALNRPGSFPNLLSALGNKLFDLGMEAAEVSYPAWTGQTAGNLPDLKPAPLISRSQMYQLDEVIDDERVNELGLVEEVLSSVQVRRFKNKFGWTPVMVANDDLGAFAEGILGFGDAAEMTVNLLCLSLLTSNPTLLDGYALFSSQHANVVASGSGAAPSAAQWQLMQNLVSAQVRIGGKGYLRGDLRVWLGPSPLVVAAKQVLAPWGDLPEVKAPTTDATINAFRGTARVVGEPELQGATPSTAYYGLLDPAKNPAVVRVYQNGWGMGPRRSTWVDPESGTAYTAYEIRVGAAIKNYRTIVRNYGA